MSLPPGESAAGFAALRRALLEFGGKRLLAPLSRGAAPPWLPLSGKNLARFTDPLGALRGPRLSLEQEMSLHHASRLTDFLARFSRAHYASAALDGGPAYARRFGLQCAYILDQLSSESGRLRRIDERAAPRTACERYRDLLEGDEAARSLGMRPAAKVLVVNDDPQIRALLELVLARAGRRTLSAGDGRAGFDLAWRWRPDIVLLNYLMPKLDGLSACALLRDNPRTWSIPILMHSGTDRPDLMEAAVRRGATAWLSLPFDWGDLSHAVELALACEQAR